jgi:hypothetical protein
MDVIECKTVLLLKMFPIADVCQQLWPQGSKAPSHDGLQTIHKLGVPIRFTFNITVPHHSLPPHLADLLSSYMDKSSHHVKHLIEFVHVLCSLLVDAHDITVSFEFVPFHQDANKGDLGFARMSLQKRHPETLLMSWPLPTSPSVDSSMEKLMVWPRAHSFLQSQQTSTWKTTRGRSLNRPLKPHCWFHYLDNTYVIWQHGPDKLTDFLHLLNSIHQSIQFTMETESEGQLLGLNIYRRLDGSLGHKVYLPQAHIHQSLHQHQISSSPIQ